MTYLTRFRSVDVELLNGRYSFAKILKAATLVGTCSHYLAGDSRFAKLLDEGHPIPGATHRFVDPHFRLPEELPAIQAELESLLKEVGDGDWVSDQINGFIHACAACIRSNTAMVVMLS